MKLRIIIVLLLTSLYGFSQDLSYGVSLGPSYTSVLISNSQENNKIDTSTTPKGVGFYFAGYLDYKLNNSFGIVTNLSMDSRRANYNRIEDYIINNTYLGINPMIKFDVNKDYNKGFYLKSGVRYSLLLSAKDKELNESAKDIFEKSNLGFLLSFGTNFSEFLGLELTLDYQLNELQKNSNTKLASAYVLVSIDLQKILSK